MNKVENITGDWIKEQIAAEYALFRSKAQDFGTFTLNPDATNYSNKISYYQSICPHEFKDHHCIYCKKLEGKNE